MLAHGKENGTVEAIASAFICKFSPLKGQFNKKVEYNSGRKSIFVCSDE